jgi:hypothetical protein
MKRDHPGCSFVLLNLALGLCLTVATVLYHRRADPFCGGALSAGFPLAFICDDTAGSPVSSWGKIDFADLFNVDRRVFLLDFTLDSAVLTLAWIILTGLRRDLAGMPMFRWGAVLCLGYLTAFLLAFVLFQSYALNFKVPRLTTPTPSVDTPTPMFDTATPVGTLSPPEPSASPTP